MAGQTSAVPEEAGTVHLQPCPLMECRPMEKVIKDQVRQPLAAIQSKSKGWLLTALKWRRTTGLWHTSAKDRIWTLRWHDTGSKKVGSYFAKSHLVGWIRGLGYEVFAAATVNNAILGVAPRREHSNARHRKLWERDHSGRSGAEWSGRSVGTRSQRTGMSFEERSGSSS